MNTESKDNLDPPECLEDGTSMESLQTECQSLSSESPPPEAVFSPIHQVPLDVLHVIFVDCFPVNPTIYSAGPIISTLSRVSSTWRAAVLSSPRLWSTLFVTVQSKDNLDKCAKVVTRWFQHARSAPLSFFLNIRFQALEEDITRIRNFLVDLSPIMLNVWHFGLHARLNHPLLRSFVDLKWKLPRLKILDLFSHAGYDRFNPIAFSSPLFQIAPNLAQVSIQNTVTSTRDIQHLLPWSQLTYINIAYKISISRWIEIMNMCPKLHRCFVALGPSNETSSSSVDSFLPNGHNLRLLEFEINGSVPLLKPLSLCNLPSLDTFYVLYKSKPFVGFPSPQEISSSSLTNLRKFSFNPGRQEISHEYLTHLIEVLREMVNLKVLVLQQNTKDFNPLYEALSFNSPGGPILPQLRTLNTWITTESELDLADKDEQLDPLFEMLSSRSREETIPAGCQILEKCHMGVENDEVHERTKERFGSWVDKLPPQFQFRIVISRDFRFEQPEGWTYPISEIW